MHSLPTVYEGASFFASKDGFPIGTRDTLEKPWRQSPGKQGSKHQQVLAANRPHVHRHRRSEQYSLRSCSRYPLGIDLDAVLVTNVNQTMLDCGAEMMAFVRSWPRDGHEGKT
jgi:hypothetical protein